ncbi:NAD(+) synthase [Alkalilimnicola sp. S0819]|uniref:NAD(+) synthase n=1 Tax=Alkalilimnicola sp. S0819 TaxID=2613922 RepID=UPI0012621878|nr:NAD(+) synthase [Alkalilimnicola sp. S0819]KAB7622851.1 NAD(+) synthase [Alkalilimnicola sp. S0819]MPQ17173.1 NAD(+) synthase [Alkalilimnicola sp. S0819]
MKTDDPWRECQADRLQRALDLDEPLEVRKIRRSIRDLLRARLHKRGVVVALSGGIDSSVCAALAAEALGPQRVFGLLLPERESSSGSLERGKLLCGHLGLRHRIHDLSAALEAVGCYRERDQAIRRLFPDYGPAWRSKIVIGDFGAGALHHFRLVVEDPSGVVHERRLGLREYLQIVAATNYKQRLRKSVEYFHADRLNYAVLGTASRLEYDQGFFVKNGDGSADLKPIAHLYKVQVYALARYLGLPAAICSAIPTTDTYSLPQGQDEFYFSLPYDKMDLALWAYNHDVPPPTLAPALALSREQTERVYRDIEAKRRATRYQHAPPLLTEAVPQVNAMV